MSNMRAEFESSVAGSSNFIYMESTGEYIHKKVAPAYKNFDGPRSFRAAEAEHVASLEKFNEQWFYWQHAWNCGAQEPQLSITDLSDDVLNAVLNEEYLVEDYQRGEGIVHNREQVRHNFISMDAGRFVLRTAFAAYKKIMNR